LLKKSGIQLSVITPGYIQTPMTDVNDFPMPFLLPAKDAALYIKRKLEKNSALISFPFPFSFAVRLMAALPNCLIDPILSRMPNKKPFSSASSLASK
jgi:short-subunit dehydrogenase